MRLISAGSQQLNEWIGFWEGKGAHAVFWVGFLYALFVGIALQFVVIPYLLSSISSLSGLLITDSIGFHQLAVENAAAIDRNGWSAWEYAPRNTPVIGLAAALYSITGVYEPWLLLPFNALVHGVSAVLLFGVLRLLGVKERGGMIALLPFIFFPSAITWYAQFHKDGVFILASFLYVYGWALLLKGPEGRNYITVLFSGSGLITLSIFVMALSRPYMLDIITVFLWLFSLYMLMYGLMRSLRWWYVAAVICVVLGSQWATDTVGDAPKVPDFSQFDLSAGVEQRQTSDMENGQHNTDADGKLPPWRQSQWRQSGWMPQVLEWKIERLSNVRRTFVSGSSLGTTNIDLDVNLTSVEDFLLYLPRAAMIGFLSPFPEHWFGEGYSGISKIMRRVSGFEMVVVYCALVGWLLAISRWWREPVFWMASSYGGGMILIFSVAVVNIGTLYRMRYGFIMIFVAIGIAALLEWRADRRAAPPSIVGAG